ncbi:hypothetical protein Tco_0102321, partial [Tanacetum coccineum]
VSGRLSKLKTAIDVVGNHGKTIRTVERPGSVKAKFFTEGANHPTHPKADEAEKARVIQTLLFLTGFNNLIEAMFGTRLPSVISGAHAFVIPIYSAIHVKR